MSLLSAYIPDAPVEDLVARRVRIELGGQEFSLPTLSIERNESWRELVNTTVPRALSALDDQADVVALVTYLELQVEPLYGLLAAYDELGLGYAGRTDKILPDWQDARALASEEDVCTAFLGVLKRAYPLAVVLLIAASDAMAGTASPGTGKGPTPSAPTKRARPTTAGRRRRSAKS